MKKASIDGLIRKSMSARVRKVPGDCPDENAFAAYLEHRLSQPEIALFESHLAECDSCQNALALGMRLCDPDAATRESAVPERKKVLFHFSIPVPVFGAAVAAIILVAVFIRIIHNPVGKPTPTPTVEPNALVLAVEPAAPKALPPAPIAGINPSNDNRTKAQRNAPIRKAVVPLQPQEKGPATASQSVQDAAITTELAPRESSVPEAVSMTAVLPPTPASGNPGGSVDTLTIDRTPSLPPTPAFGSLGGSSAALAGGTTAAMLPAPASANPEENRAALPAKSAVSLPPPMNADGGRAGGGFGMGASANRSSGVGGGMGGGMGAMGGMGGGMGSPGGAGAGGMGGFGGFGGGGGFGGVAPNRGSSNVPAPKKIGDKEFYLNSGWWIDRQARYKPDDFFIDITSTDPEYESILTRYKELRNLRPVLIYWKNEFYILR